MAAQTGRWLVGRGQVPEATRGRAEGVQPRGAAALGQRRRLPSSAVPGDVRIPGHRHDSAGYRLTPSEVRVFSAVATQSAYFLSVCNFVASAIACLALAAAGS
jgi:hypothetical protein